MEKLSFQTQAPTRSLHLVFIRISAMTAPCATRISAAVTHCASLMLLSPFVVTDTCSFAVFFSVKPNLKDSLLKGYSARFCFCLILSPSLDIYWNAILTCISVERGHHLFILMALTKLILTACLPELCPWGSFWPPSCLHLTFINLWAAGKSSTGNIQHWGLVRKERKKTGKDHM